MTRKLKAGNYKVKMEAHGEYMTLVVDKVLCIELKKNDQGYIVDGWGWDSKDKGYANLVFTNTIWNDDLEGDE